MSTALAIWSTRVEPGKKSTIVARSDIRITGAALDAMLADEKARSSVKLTFMNVHADDSDENEEDVSNSPTITTILCSLTPGKIEQSQLDLVINEDDAVQFELIGKNPVYLTGNYISQPADFSSDESDIYSDEEHDEDFDLRDHGSDAEPDAAEIDNDQDDSHRFEEIKSEGEKEKELKKEKSSSPSSKKRPRESDVTEASTGGEQKLSKKQQKKLNKKLKAENGQAVPKQEQKAEEKKEKEDKKGGEKKKKRGQTITTPSGLQITDVKVGAGKTAKKGDKVSIRYVGKLTNGKVFDENMNRKPLTIKLGNGEVIKGWDEGIVGMQAGGERVLVIPPRLGYGSRKMGDQIPANSTLEFKCKLLEIKS